jgi:hypothetical protein
MHNTKDELDQLTVKSPCPMDWEKMQGNEAERFCQQCQKNVYNLSALSRGEALQLLSNRQQSICLRMEKDEDGFTLTRDTMRHPRAIHRGLSALLTACLGLLTIVMPVRATSWIGTAWQQKQGKETTACKTTKRRTRKRSRPQMVIGAIVPTMVLPLHPVRPAGFPQTLTTPAPLPQDELKPPSPPKPEGESL